MPTPADAVDTVAAEKLTSEASPSPSDTHSQLPGGSGTAQTDTAGTGGSKEDRELAESQELYENPFLKPPKRIKLKILS